MTVVGGNQKSASELAMPGLPSEVWTDQDQSYYPRDA